MEGCRIEITAVVTPVFFSETPSELKLASSDSSGTTSAEYSSSEDSKTELTLRSSCGSSSKEELSTEEGDNFDNFDDPEALVEVL